MAGRMDPQSGTEVAILIVFQPLKRPITTAIMQQLTGSKQTMNEFTNTQEMRSGPESNRTAGDSAPAIEMVQMAVEALNIVRKNAQAYPSGHILLKKSIQKALKKIEQVLETVPEFRLDVIKNRLSFNGKTLESNRVSIAEYTKSIHQAGIASLTFYPGLEATEIEALQNVIKWDPKELWNAGGPGSILAERNIQHIIIEEIDYSALGLSEETADRTKNKCDDEQLLGLWKRFVESLINKNFTTEEKQHILSDQDGSRQIANLLNNERLDSRQALKSFHQLLTRQADESLKKGASVSKSKALRGHFNDLLKNLKPELRQQFLTVTFRNLSHRDMAEASEEILGNLSDELVIEMLHIANKKNRQISPALIRLIQKMSGARSSIDQNDRFRKEQSNPFDAFQNVSIDQMKHLFERESYEHYVDADYDLLLGNIAAVSVNDCASIKDFEVEQNMQSLSEASLDERIDRLLFGLLDSNIDSESYRAFVDKITTSIPTFLDSGRFGELIDLFKTLNRHSTDKSDAIIRRLAANTLKTIASESFLLQMEQAYQKWSQDIQEDLGQIYLALGPACIPVLLDRYTQNANRDKREWIQLILTHFGNAPLEEAYRRLNTPDSGSVLEMVKLIRKIGSEASVSHVEHLLNHQDTGVRIAAIDLVLTFGKSSGILALHRLLYSEESQEVFRALFLVGKFRLKESTTLLVRMINNRPLSKLDIDLNEGIIQTLGKIGDAAVVPTLEKLVHSKWSIHPGRMHRMKMAIFESLAGYPYQSVEGLLKVGLTSRSNHIRNLCGMLANRHPD